MTYIVISLLQFLSFYSLDNLLYMFISKESTRYFVLHTFFNLYIIWLCWSTFISCLFKPMQIFDIDYNNESILSTLSIINFHVYHLVTHVQELSMETMMHHLIGAIFNPILTINQPIGKLPVMHNIILCGIPGGIDYVLLSLVKYKIIPKITEKQINRYLNLLIRWPFIFLSDYFYIINIYNDNINFNYYMLIPMLINNYNAVYFCDKVIGNYYIYDESTSIRYHHIK